MIVILMGVSGSGKTTIGLKLAGDLGWRFLDTDDFPASGNSQGNTKRDATQDATEDATEDATRNTPGITPEAVPPGQSSDADLEAGAALRAEIAALVASGKNAVLACSALTVGYRRLLTVDARVVRFVYLKGSAGMIRRRLRSRSGHFSREQILAGQFAALEEPTEVVTIDIDERPGRIIEQIRQALAI